MTSKSFKRDLARDRSVPWPCMKRVLTMCIIGHDHGCEEVLLVLRILLLELGDRDSWK
jgi:hypothetical protein